MSRLRAFQGGQYSGEVPHPPLPHHGARGAHDELQEDSQWEDVYEALTDLQEVVVEEPWETFTAIRDMATNNLGSDIQDTNTIANTSRS